MDGWKSKRISNENEYLDARRDEFVSWNGAERDAPETVRLVPRLRDDLSCLLAMFSPENPPIKYVRSNQICVALYGFGDTSGSGFGSTLGSKEGLKYRVGIWE